MKNKVIYGSLFGLVLLVLVLSYYFSQKPSNNITGSNTSSTPPQIAKDGSGNIIPLSAGTSTSSGTPSKAPSPEEQQAFKDMMNSPNLRACDKETTEAGKSQCEDQMIFMRATLQKNPTACNTIKNPESLWICVANTVKIIAGSELVNPCLSLAEGISKVSCTGAFVTIQATIKNDPALCESISNNIKKNVCKNTVIITEAMTKKDASICLKLDDTTARKNCTTAVK